MKQFGVKMTDEELTNFLIYHDYCARYTLYPDKVDLDYDRFSEWWKRNRECAECPAHQSPGGFGVMSKTAKFL